MDQKQKTADVVEKIRKLLALAADNPNEGERDTALGIAHRLMLEHGVDARAVESHQATRDALDGFVEQDIVDEKCTGITMFHRAAAAITARYFFVQILFMRQVSQQGLRITTRLVGRPEHVAIGVYVFAFVTREFRERVAKLKRQANERRAALKSLEGVKVPTWKDPKPDVRAFLFGLEMGLSEKLRAEELRASAPRPGGDSGAGLVALRQNLSQACALRYPNLKDLPPPKGNPAEEMPISDLIAGLTQGRSINIRKPLGSDCATEPEQLTAPLRRLEGTTS